MRAKKYMAWIITAAMLVTSIPFSEKRVKADVLPEGTQMKFVVKDLDGTIIKNSEEILMRKRFLNLKLVMKKQRQYLTMMNIPLI